MGTLLCRAGEVYLIILFARIVISWFPISPNSAMASVYGVLYTVTEPVLAPIRRIIPPTGMGGMGLDWSPLIATIALVLVSRALCA
ncbi:MAG TPA: YggT family protein [Acidimicrobiales bacterium]|nr:YggT family protein [Acidimicrobiales bacterium]